MTQMLGCRIDQVCFINWAVDETTLNMIFSVIWYFYVTMVTSWMTLMHKWTNGVMDGGWVHPLAKTLPCLAINLWFNTVVDDENLDEESLQKWQWLQ